MKLTQQIMPWFWAKIKSFLFLCLMLILFERLFGHGRRFCYDLKLQITVQAFRRIRSYVSFSFRVGLCRREVSKSIKPLF